MLAVDRLEVAYGDLKVIDGVSLQVEQGELVCIIGSNGAGKTALIKAVSGYIPVRGGSVTFMGRSVTSLPGHALVEQGIVRVPEGRQLFSDMTVSENLELGGFCRRARKERAGQMERVFDYFPRLAERRHQSAGTLSGGEQQMLAIGRGLMARPKLLMLDEVSLGLAPLVVEDIYRIILEINRTGITVLVVEQNVEIALGNASRGYVLENGRIALQGAGADLLCDEHVKKAYLGI